MIVLSIDPSGNYVEGKGHTGYALFSVDNDAYTMIEYGTVRADDFPSRSDYWGAVNSLLEKSVNLLVIEDYRLYNTSAMGARTQSYSLLETPRLLGLIEFSATKMNLPIIFQMAVDTKPYSDDILVKLGVLEKRKGRYYYKEAMLNDHERSAVRHFFRWYDRRKK